MATDGETGQSVEVFSPRAHRWAEHFQLTDDFLIMGKTAMGRATVQLLCINRPLAIQIRREEALRAKYLTQSST